MIIVFENHVLYEYECLDLETKVVMRFIFVIFFKQSLKIDEFMKQYIMFCNPLDFDIRI